MVSLRRIWSVNIMKWLFEFTDLPKNPFYPLVAYQELDSGEKRGPFYLSIDELIRAMREEMEVDHEETEYLIHGEAICSPVLPKNVINYATNKEQTKEQITIELPKQQFDIKYQNTNAENIFFLGFPRMVVQFSLVKQENSKRKLVDTKIFAVLDDGKPINEETPLYSFPYTNVGKQNGVVCWGSNTALYLEELSELNRAFQMFISSPFNEDRGVRTTHGIGNFRKLIDCIEGLPFDDEWLIPINQALKDI